MASYEEEKNFYRVGTIVCTVAACISLTAIFVLCYTIIRFKTLRTNTSSIILLHIIILQGVYAFCAPLSMWMFLYYNQMNVTLYIVVNVLRLVVSIGILLFLLLLVADWFLKTYNERSHAKFWKVAKFVVIGLHFAIAAATAASSVYVVLYDYDMFDIILPYILLNIAFITFVNFMLIVHKIKVRNLMTKPKNNLGLAIANIFVLFWSPVILSILLPYLNIHAYARIFSLLCLKYFLSPVAYLVYLYKYVDSYEVALKAMVWCKCKEYDNEARQYKPVQ